MIENGVTREYVENTYKEKIKSYYSNWHREVNLDIIPECLSVNDIDNILDIMIKKGLTFLSAYYFYKDNKIKMIYIDDIVLPYKFASTVVTDKKIDNKIRGLHLGLLNTVIINSKYRMIDGYAIYTIFKQNKEIFIPCEFRESIKVYNNSHSIDRFEIRKSLYDKEDGKCYICGRQMTLSKNTEKFSNIDATIDHIIPLAKGGTNDISNCAACCRQCNKLKSDMILTDELKKQIKEIVIARG
ncbi:MAG: HNH endonuclease [Lachnospiraceae bacterium]|nr:HNH endonuclease [Lachnospiraceae bacterium]